MRQLAAVDAHAAVLGAARERRTRLHIVDLADPAVAPVSPQPEVSEIAEGALPSVSAGQDPTSVPYPRPDLNRRYRRERATS